MLWYLHRLHTHPPIYCESYLDDSQLWIQCKCNGSTGCAALFGSKDKNVCPCVLKTNAGFSILIWFVKSQHDVHAPYMALIMVVMTVRWLTRTQWCWSVNDAFQRVSHKAASWEEVTLFPFHLHPSYAALQRPFSQHNAKKPLRRLLLYLHVTQLSPETICLSQPSSYSMRAHPTKTVSEKCHLYLLQKHCSLSSACAIPACCFSSHKWSLNGRRHAWQRGVCLGAGFLLS